MFTELYSVYFSDFAVPATVAGVALKGIFDKEYQESYGIVAGDNPVLLIQSDLVSPVEGDAVIVNSTNYTVASTEPNGTGLTILQLELA